MTKFEAAILRNKLVQSIIMGSKHTVLPGFQGLSLYNVTKFFVKEAKNTKLIECAAAVTYNFLMAMPPSFLFLFSLVPYLPLSNVEHTILQTLHYVTPNEHAYKGISSFIVDFMHTRRRDVLSFGVLLVLFFSSNGIMGLMRSFDRSLAVEKKRSGLSRRWTAIKLTFVMMGVAVASLAVLVIQNKELNVIVLSVFHNITAVKLLSAIILVVISYCAISIIYIYGPRLSNRFKFISPGAVLATGLSILATSAFFFVVNNIINYNKIYGSIGSLIAFMVWVWLNTLVILIGYELNVSILLGKISTSKDVVRKKV
ncbi:MAG: YihY/virulence factor BrkB family protein [Taibaiella sp.]|nr:YihY/virulence factor BrkB family protein [Taibaiella sp.]